MHAQRAALEKRLHDQELLGPRYKIHCDGLTVGSRAPVEPTGTADHVETHRRTTASG